MLHQRERKISCPLRPALLSLITLPQKQPPPLSNREVGWGESPEKTHASERQPFPIRAGLVTGSPTLPRGVEIVGAPVDAIDTFHVLLEIIPHEGQAFGKLQEFASLDHHDLGV